MSPDQRKDSISLSHQNLQDSVEKVQPYTLEEFSYDHFRSSGPFLPLLCLNGKSCESCKTNANKKVYYSPRGEEGLSQTPTNQLQHLANNIQGVIKCNPNRTICFLFFLCLCARHHTYDCILSLYTLISSLPFFLIQFWIRYIFWFLSIL